MLLLLLTAKSHLNLSVFVNVFKLPSEGSTEMLSDIENGLPLFVLAQTVSILGKMGSTGFNSPMQQLQETASKDAARAAACATLQDKRLQS